MAGVHPRHETAARRRADRAAGVALSEAHPFRSQSIHVRSLDFLLSVTPRITVTQVVGEDENDVRPALRLGAEPFEVRRLRVADVQSGEQRRINSKATGEFHEGRC